MKKKQIRMLHKDCIMKKIKSRFFKFFANQYMINFANHMNTQKIYNLKEIIYFSKIKNYFLIYAKLQQHFDWKFVDKSIFEIFHDHSDTNLDQLYIIFTQNKELFDKLTNGLDEITKFVLLQPFKVVFKKFLENQRLFDSFMGKMKEDIIKRKFKGKSSMQNFVDYYYFVFKKTLFKFIEYYTDKVLR